MEIQLKVALVEIRYSKFSRFLNWFFIAIIVVGVISAAWLPRIAAGCMVLCWPLRIGISYLKDYKVIGEIILGYHHITANGERFFIKDMKDINVSIEREPAFSRTPVILSGTNNIISFDDHSFRMLLNNKDIEAVDFLVRVWEENYRLKVGHNV